MRRLNDIKKVAGFIVGNFMSSEFEMTEVQDGSINVKVPYLPSSIASLISSEIRIGVFPYNDKLVLVNIYKL